MPFLLRYPDWKQEGLDWPHRADSRFVRTRRHRWHIQRAGQGQKVLLLHGTGASVHSWADLFSRLKADFEVLSLDLPGHGFTRTDALRFSSVEAMTEDIADLLHSEEFSPELVIGHSAGAVLASNLAITGAVSPVRVISINGAYEPFPGLVGAIAPVMAKALYYNPLMAITFASSAKNRKRVEGLIEQTGSVVPVSSVDAYAALLQCSGHVSGALGMMAHWNLADVSKAVAQTKVPHLFLVGDQDKAVPPLVSEKLANTMPHADVQRLAGLGHLLHEEDPETVAAVIRKG
ncbi:MAG: alpha/beta fold hydrolase BchO [Pseudomonadota bacterium]